MSARPQRADARRNRERVLAAAREAFASEGLTVPLDEIARRAGVGAGTVHRHFPTKEALYAAIVSDYLRERTERARALAARDDPGEALELFFRELAVSGAGNRAFTDALTKAGTDVTASPVGEAGRELLDAFGELLERAQRAGTVREDITVTQIKALLLGVLTAGDWLGADAGTRRHLADVLCTGFRPRH
ncbi:TetR/AcrR family transcriptional regulator [Prauserella flavalba]|uniref:TetR/AcrR family transcriptional regulator n=1 Tax=Prauserella flavalba TaxID=1477506 RepID=UPI0036E05382